MSGKLRKKKEKKEKYASFHVNLFETQTFTFGKHDYKPHPLIRQVI